MNPYESPIMARLVDVPEPPKPQPQRFPWWSVAFLVCLPGLWFVIGLALIPIREQQCIALTAAAFWFWPFLAACYRVARYAIG